MINLKQAQLPHLKNNNWVDYFTYNNTHLLQLDFDSPDPLSPAEKSLITSSIQAFQIGEYSRGFHFKKLAAKFSKTHDYPEYSRAIDLFIAEENRHSGILKQFMLHHQIPLTPKNSLDHIFRFLRQLFDLQNEIIVLVTAEMIAISYYTALSKVTNSPLLKTICQQMLNDELMHVIFQSQTLHLIAQQQNSWQNKIITFYRQMLMKITTRLVWQKYRQVFMLGGYSWSTFYQNCLEYLRESTHIVQTDKILV